MTNFDIIKKMNKKELAKFIEHASCPPFTTSYQCKISSEDCEECWFIWLGENVEDHE